MMRELTPIDREELPLIERAREWLATRYGPIASFEWLAGPHEHRAYYPVAFVQFQDGRELVAKWETKPEKLRKEFAVAKLLAAHHIPTVDPIELNLDPLVLTMERLEGRTLTEDEVTPTVAGEIGTLLAQIHAIPPGEAEAAGIPTWEGRTFQEEMACQFEQRFRSACEYLPPELPADEVSQAYQTLIAATTWTGQRALNRRDAHAENWFRLADGGLAAIDHGNASVGDLSYDLAHILNEFRHEPARVAAFREAYGSEVFDQAATPTVQAIVNLIHGLGIVGWVMKRGVPQPRFEAEAHAFIREALVLAASL